jgi:putative phosphoesterase
MVLGIMSDSHGDGAATARAIRLLLDRGAGHLVHCGDLCGTSVLDELAGHPCTFVWGNCDDPGRGLARYVRAIGLSLPAGPAELALDGRRIGVFHGHEPAFREAAENGRYDYLLYGHTHRYADERQGHCRLINPGALHRARVKTVALLDLRADALVFLELQSGRPVDGPKAED